MALAATCEFSFIVLARNMGSGKVAVARERGLNVYFTGKSEDS